MEMLVPVISWTKGVSLQQHKSEMFSNCSLTLSDSSAQVNLTLEDKAERTGCKFQARSFASGGQRAQLSSVTLVNVQIQQPLHGQQKHLHKEQQALSTVLSDAYTGRPLFLSLRQEPRQQLRRQPPSPKKLHLHLATMYLNPSTTVTVGWSQKAAKFTLQSTRDQKDDVKLHHCYSFT